nr:hypothetical protein [Planococcus glaciei]
MAKTIAGSEKSIAHPNGNERQHAVREERPEGHIPDFEAIEESAGFRELMRKKKSFFDSDNGLIFRVVSIV